MINIIKEINRLSALEYADCRMLYVSVDLYMKIHRPTVNQYNLVFNLV